MERMRGEARSNGEDENEGYGSPKLSIIKQKPHRKLLSGLHLFKNVKPSRSIPESHVWMKRRREVNDHEANNEEEEVPEQKHLPYDLMLHHILTRLSIKTLLQFKSVSKEWYYTISSDEFAVLHLRSCLSSYHPSSPIDCLFIQAENNYYLLFYEEQKEVLLDYYFVKLETNFDLQDRDELHLVGSCNGLVCLANSSSDSGYFYIWNPVTHVWCKFSDPCLLSFSHRTCWGFAYVSSRDDYKVVRLVQNCNTLKILAHVFSLRTGKWKQVEDHGLEHNMSLTKTDPGVLVDETLCWLMETSSPNKSLLVVGFDLVQEKFVRIPGLVPRSISHWHQLLFVMGGCLSMCELNMSKEVHISILKRPGEVESMCLSSDLGLKLCSGLLGFTRAGRFFVVSKNWELALIDPNSSPKQYTPLIIFRKSRKPSMVSFIPSVISPLLVSESKKD